jgi:hypothetical protein
MLLRFKYVRDAFAKSAGDVQSMLEDYMVITQNRGDRGYHEARIVVIPYADWMAMCFSMIRECVAHSMSGGEIASVRFRSRMLEWKESVSRAFERIMAMRIDKIGGGQPLRDTLTTFRARTVKAHTRMILAHTDMMIKYNREMEPHMV